MSRADRWVYKAIDRARRSGATMLDLSRRGLKSLPHELGRLTALRTLYLQQNRLRDLPPGFRRLTALQTLRLDGNQLSSLPPQLGRLTDLRTLSLQQNELSSLPSELGRLTALRSLSLQQNRLSSLPSELGRLNTLRSLSLQQNRLRSLPPELGGLTALRSLDLQWNELESLPPELGRLRSLVELNLRQNQLRSLPPELGGLVALEWLSLQNNQLSSLPPELGGLTSLQTLRLEQNELRSLPPELGRLTALRMLDLQGNQLSSLPPELGRLTALEWLLLDPDQLSFPPPAVVGRGTQASLALLRSYLEGETQRAEAKLILLGDGGEGKTCLSRALRGMPFARQDNTQGVEIREWVVSGPPSAEGEPQELKINLWDFEGQQINHQSHQFFLTERTIYVLVFNGRRSPRPDRIEYWLETIRSRAPGCQVTLVATECEERQPLLRLDTLQQRFPEQLEAPAEFLQVGCANPDDPGITQLRQLLIERAGALDHVPQRWPLAYAKAEEALRERARAGTHIERRELYAVFATSGIPADTHEIVARIFGDLGVLTHFPDSVELHDFVVLQPSWLTKAISKALEHPRLVADQGLMQHAWLRELWDADYAGLFQRLYACMREFELCYRLEDGQDFSLVPLRFPFPPEDIPWDPPAGAVERRIEYRFEVNPPAGLMSRLIVKVHHLVVTTERRPKGVYWHYGVFVATGRRGTPLRSEALLTLDPERRVLRIQARSLHPQKIVEQLDAFAKAVFAFFQGFRPVRFYGCVRADETPCPQVHRENRVLNALRRGKEIACEPSDDEGSWHDVEPNRLVRGLHSFGEREELQVVLRRELDQRPEWAESFGNLQEDIARRLEQLESLLPASQTEQQAVFLQMVQQNQRDWLTLLDEREVNRTPALFLLVPKRKQLTQEGFLLRFYCEHEEGAHPGAKTWEFKRARGWWAKTAPLLQTSLSILALTAQVAPTILPALSDDPGYALIKQDVEATSKLVRAGSKLEVGDPDDPSAGWRERARTRDDPGLRRRYSVERCHRARHALNELMRELDPASYEAREFGNLKRIHIPDRSFRWLCPEHRRPFIR